MKIIQILILVVLTIQNSHAQLEEIVVTASMRGGSYYDMPAVTLKKKADFLVQDIQLVNDSRSYKLRKSEIIQTISSLINSSKSIQGIELSYGDGFVVPVNLNDDSLQIIEDNKRIDTSYVNIFVKISLDGNRSSKKKISNLRNFIKNAKLSGRTEILPSGDVGLTIIGPEQYRYKILEKISTENKKLMQAVGGECEMALSGLEGRVEWQRSGVDELILYIGYASEITCK